MSRNLRVVAVLWMLIGVTIVRAQPPGGGDTPGGRLPGGDIELPDIEIEVPDIDDIEVDIKPDIEVDIKSEEIRATASAIEVPAVQDQPFDATTFDFMMENFEVPEDWAQIQITDEMPSRDDILAMIDDLPHDIDIQSLDIQQGSSPEATTAIIGYASSMLGKVVTPLYAGVYDDSTFENNETTQETLNQIYSQLPAEMQSMMAQADSLGGITYWALLEDGLALVYTGDCEIDQCSITQDMVQVEIEGGSAGAYAVYSNNVASSADEAKALVQSTYPHLAMLDLAETETSYGTAFFAFSVDMDSSKVTAYYAGVYTIATGQSVVYVVSGIGDAYINILLGGS